MITTTEPMKNADKPAYPAEVMEPAVDDPTTHDIVCYPGLTKREAFAMAAMQGILSNAFYTGDNAPRAKTIAEWAIEQADETLSLLEESKPLNS